MCLLLKSREEKSKIAEEDIIVYKKVDRIIQNFPHKLHGKKFKGIIDDIACEGVISIYNNILFLCTNNPLLKGISCNEKFEFLYSWWLDPFVEELVVDDKTLIKKYWVISKDFEVMYKTPFMRFTINIGELYTSELIKNGRTIEKAIHSFKNKEDAEDSDIIGPIVECIIPKGSEYYIGEFAGVESIASNCLKYVKLCV